MVVSQMTFRRVLDLPKVDWTHVSAERQADVVARCEQLLRQLPQVHEIEGVRKFDGAKYLYEQALVKTLELLGAPITNTTKDELLVDNFLA